MHAIIAKTTSIRRLKTIRHSDGVSVPAPTAGTADAGGRRSASRRRPNHSTSQSTPAAPTTWNGRRQLPVSGVISAFMTSGVTIAPTDVPLWSTPFPSDRSRSESRARVVRIPHGQCPASKKPSSIRQWSRSPWSWAKLVANPTADHAAKMKAYNQRTDTRSDNQPKTNDPAAKEYANTASIWPYCAWSRWNSFVIRTDALASVWRSM